MKIGIIGVGVVGGALLKAARQKGFKVYTYDKFKPEYNEALHVLDTDICFICLPTPTVDKVQEQRPLHEALSILSGENYSGVVVIKSTVLPGTTMRLSHVYKNLRIVHNPEFLTAKKAFEETMNQPAVLIGADNPNDMIAVFEFWRKFDEQVPIYTFQSKTTELAKYVHNCFLAVKVSFFNEIYELCNVTGTDYESVLSAALSIGQIGKGHTKVPGPDGSRGYGGMCFPKDTNALSGFMELMRIKPDVLDAAIEGNNRRRPGEQ